MRFNTVIMNVFIISYDLKAGNPVRNEQLLGKIKTYHNYICLGNSAYLIETEMSSVDVRDSLKFILTEGDILYVGRVTSPAAWYGLPAETSDWIREHL